MSTAKNFEDLDIWKEAMNISTDVFFICQKEKLKREWSINDQIRRASLSISNNIAEGFEYNNNNFFVKYLRIAKGSCGEVKSMVLFLEHIAYIGTTERDQLYEKTQVLSKKIGSLINYLLNLKAAQTRNQKPHPLTKQQTT